MTMKNSRDPHPIAFPMKFGKRFGKPGRRAVVVLAALVLSIGSAPPALATETGTAPQAAVGTLAVGSGPAGRDYATDVFGDPWDYSNGADLVLDAGPTMGLTAPSMSGGMAALWIGVGSS